MRHGEAAAPAPPQCPMTAAFDADDVALAIMAACGPRGLLALERVSTNLRRLSRQSLRARSGPFAKVEAWAKGRYLARALLATEPPRSSGWGEGRGVACVAISDGRVASARCDGVASVWDSGASLSTWRHTASFAHDDAVMAVAIRARYVATGCRDGCVRVWSIDAPATPHLAFDAHDGGVFAIGWTGPARPDEFAARRARGAPPSATLRGGPTELAESRLLSGGADRTVRLWDTGAATAREVRRARTAGAVTTLALGEISARSRRIFASPEPDFSIGVRSSETLEVVATPLRGHTKPVRAEPFVARYRYQV